MTEETRIRIAICGYGNLGKGVEKAINKNKDMKLVVIFSRRNPKDLHTTCHCPIFSMENIEKWKDEVDVVIMCGGSATDLPLQTAQFTEFFNTIDSYDTHANIPNHYENVNKIALENGHLCVISVGWDPGLFSINRAYAEAALPEGNTHTFWGKGVSQGHSDAVRRIEGVKNAIQYTIPKEEALEEVRGGVNSNLATRQKHLRECFVVLEESADPKKVEQEIKTMPNYFSDYDTIVHFISEEELKKDHSKMPHGGFVIRSGNTTEENKQVIEYSLKLDSNPEFTASVLISYARATYRLYQKGERGARTVLDIPPILLLQEQREDVIKRLL